MMLSRREESSGSVSGVMRRLAILSVAACVLVSGCGVQEGQKKIENARDAKKQVENIQDKLEKKLEEGQ